MKNLFSNVLTAFSAANPKHILSVDISVAALKLAGFESSLNGLRLISYEIKRIDPTFLFNEQAEELIKAFVAEHGLRLNGNSVIMSISQSEGVFVKYVVLPNLPANEILGAAKWLMKDEVPFDQECAVVDFQKVRETTDDQGIKQQGYLFCLVQKEIIEAYLEILEHCRLSPIRVTIASFDYARLTLEQGGQEQAAVILDINERNIFLSFYWDHRLAFLRRLPVSWEKVALALGEPFDVGRGQVSLSAVDMERVKSIPGLLIGDTESLVHDMQAFHAASLIRPFLETLVREVKFSMAYFGSSFIVDRPQTLYLTGSVSDLKDLEHYLKNELDMKVDFLKPPHAISIPQQLYLNFTGQQKLLMPGLGAVLNGSVGLDLLPADLKYQRSQQSKRMLLRLSAIAVFLFLFCSTSFSILRQQDYQRQIENARIHLQAMDAIQRMSGQITARQELWQKIVRNKVPGEMVLRVISDVIPGGIILDQISFDQTTKEVRISGSLAVSSERQSENQLIDFVQKLDETDVFLSATLLSTKKGPVSDQFEISATVAAGI